MSKKIDDVVLSGMSLPKYESPGQRRWAKYQQLRVNCEYFPHFQDWCPDCRTELDTFCRLMYPIEVDE